MSGVFNDEHENKIDSKARLSIPAQFRRKLEAGDPDWAPGKNASMCILSGGASQQYLEVYTVHDMNRIWKRVERVAEGTNQRKALDLKYGAQLTIATLDETGRVVLPAKLRNKLDLSDTATLVGLIKTFQIWKPETYALHSVTFSDNDPYFDPNADPAIYLPPDVD